MKAGLVMMIITLAMGLYAQGQSFSDKVNKEVGFEKKTESNTLILANINGSVEVTGYDGDKVIVEITRNISAKTDQRLQKGKDEVQLGFIDRADTLIFYVAASCNNFGKYNKNENNGHDLGGWTYHWNDCQGKNNNCRSDYDYTMHFTVKVPSNINLILSTINDGDIKVSNVKGAVEADNINGSIRLTNVMKEVQVSTINGDLDIDYANNPVKASRYYTLNGDINANFQKGLAAQLNFESFNGSLYTNVPKLESLPLAVEKEPTPEGIKYKVNGNRFKVGNGGVALDFETFNGDVYVKEK